jgi:hypothetical protein
MMFAAIGYLSGGRSPVFLRVPGGRGLPYDARLLMELLEV